MDSLALDLDMRLVTPSLQSQTPHNDDQPVVPQRPAGVKEGLYRIWCGVNTLGDSGVNTLGDTSAFVNPAGQLLLTRRGKIRMDGVGIVSNQNQIIFILSR